MKNPLLLKLGAATTKNTFAAKTTKTFKNPTSTRSRFNIFKFLSAFAFVMLLGVSGVMGQAAASSTWSLSSTGTATNVGAVTGTTLVNTGYLGTSFSSGFFTTGTSSATTWRSDGSSSTASNLSPGFFNGAGITVQNLLVSISPNQGNNLSITSISIPISQSSGTATSSYAAAAYSLDGFTSTSFTMFQSGATTAGVNLPSNNSIVSLSSSSTITVNNGSTLTLRIIVWRKASSTNSSTTVKVGSIAISGTTTSSATNFFWNGATSAGVGPATGGTGTWNTGNTNWISPTNDGSGTGVVWGNSATSNANINNGTGTITIPASLTANTTIIGTTGYSFATSGISPITLSGGLTLTNALGLAPIAAAPLSLTGAISGASLLTLNGLGATTLSGTNINTGGITLTSGTLNINSTTALGATAGTLTINGGTIDNSTAGSITNANNNPITFGGDFAFTGTNALNLGTGAVALGASANRTLTANASTLTIGGIISGTSSSLTKAGAGTLALSGANAFDGGLNINAGTVSLAASNVLADAGAVNVNGGILNSAGAFTETIGALTLTSGSITGATGTLTASSIAVQAGTIDAILTGTGVMTKSTSGTVFLTNGSNSYLGGTVINGGILSVNGANRLGSTAVGVTINAGTFQLTTTSISSGSAITLGSASSTFDVASGITYTTSAGGVFSSTGSLNKTGAGTLALAIANTYSGSTNINGGTIRLNAGDVLPLGDVSLDGGTLSTGSSAGFNETVGTLNLNSTGTIALGTGSHTLTFAASNGVTWAGTALNVTGWTGTAGATGTAGKIFVGTDATGLTAGQLAKITFTGYAGVTATILSTGEIVPNVSLTPTISTIGTLVAVSTTYGTASATRTTFTASGTNLSANISISAPSGYEISQTSGGASGYATTQTLTQSGGTVTTTTIYVRLAATSTVAGSPYTGNIALSSTGATTVNVATVSSSVGTATLTIINLSAANKTYDRANTVSVSGTAAFSGLMNSESFTPSGSVTWAFADVLVGASKTLSRTGTYAAPNTNYTVTQPSLTASITALTLTTSGSAAITSKTYDRTTTATVTGLSLTNVINGDLVTIVGTYNDKTVNTGKAVTISLTGADIANYTWTAPTGITGDITALALTISTPVAVSKVSDGTTAATITGSLSGVISGDVVNLSLSGTFASSSIGTGIAVTSTSSLSGADASNYTLTQPLGLTANITVQVAGLLLLEDNFTHSAILTSNGYTASSATGTNNLTAGATGLTYSNYGSSNIGNALAVANNGQDIYRTFTQQNSPTTVYASFLVKVSAALTGDYIFALASSSNSTYRARTFIKASSNSGFINFGISNSGSVNYNSTPTDYAVNTTHLVVVKYTFTSATTATATVFVNPNTSSEPTTSEVSFTDNTGANNAPADINSFSIRQGSSTAAPTLVMDGIRIATNWGALMGNPQYNGTTDIGAGNYNTINILSGTVTATGNVTVNGTTTNDGVIAIGANTLTLNGAVVNTSGTLTGSATSNLTIGGAAGTLNFTNGSRSLNNLSLGASGSATLGTALDINGTVGFTAGGSLNMNAQAVTLKSTATATASVSDLTGSTLSGATNVTVERYIPAKRAWRALTSPVNTTNSISANWQENAIDLGAGYRLYGLDIWSNSGGTGIITGGVGSSLLAYNSNNTWSGITDTTLSSSLLSNSKNKPFMAFVTGPYGSNNITAGATATTIRATGNLFTGNQTYTCGANEYNFIGNPYASPLSLTAMLADTNNAGFVGNIWIWDANASGLNAVGNYNLFDGTTYTNLFSNILNSGTQIQSGQAFFVRSTLGGTFTIKESHKGTSFSNAIFRDAAPAQLLRVGLYKQINSEWSGRDGAMTVITPDADANQTPNKMANGTENVAFTKNSGLFASNHHLPLIAADVLNVKVWNTTAGTNYKLKIYTEEFTATNLDATLEDLFTNARTPLPLDGTAVEYPFSVTTDALSTGNRFRIVFQTSALGINNPKANAFSILPNPVTGDSFQVNLGILATGTYSYTICNALGQEVEKGSINTTAQNTNYTVKFRETAATGIYIMKIKGTDNSVFTAKIIKK